jgi:type II secretory pathway component PulF
MTATKQKKAEQGFLAKLKTVKLGGGQAKAIKVKKNDLAYIFRNISTLIENGLSLPKSLETLEREPSLKKYESMLRHVKSLVESGESFSGALTHYESSFSEIIINQVRVGERSGTMPQTLKRLVDQLELAGNLKETIIKKLAYPVMLVVIGSGAITFMLLFVVPTFEKTYAESGAELPGITKLLISAGQFGTAYGWMILLALITFTGSFIYARTIPAARFWIDKNALRVPVLGNWLKNIAVLQFMEVLGNLMDAGFNVVDALRACIGAIGNRAVRRSVEELHAAILRGERFSAELEKHGDLFPPVVNQLVIIGEKTGTLGKATVDIRAHLRREVERYTNMLIGTIEPVLTIGLATAIGGIILAIYLPMFDMIGAMGGDH